MSIVRNKIRRSLAVITSVAMLASCGPDMGSLGFDDGTDSCRRQLETLNSTGNYFAQNIIAGAAVGAVTGAALGALGSAIFGGNSRDIGRAALIGGAVGGVAGGVGGYWTERQRQAQNDATLARNAVASDLAKENQELDRTQVAFSQLMDCRYAQRNQIFASYRAGRLTRPQANAELTRLRTRVQNDIAVAQRINQNVGRRGSEFDVAIENVAPGSRTRSAAAPRSYTTSQTVVLRSSPNSNAPEVTQVSARQAVTVRPVDNNFALVETADGMRGYAPAASVGTRGITPTAASGRGGEVNQLAATNISRRESFNESIETAQRLAASPSTFEIAS